MRQVKDDRVIKHALIITYDWSRTSLRPFYARVVRDRAKTLFVRGEQSVYESRYRKADIRYKFYVNEQEAIAALKGIQRVCGIDSENELKVELAAASKFCNSAVNEAIKQHRWIGGE